MSDPTPLPVIPIDEIDPEVLGRSDRKAYERTKKASGICPQGYKPAIILGEFSGYKGPKKTVRDTCAKCNLKRVNRMGPCQNCTKLECRPTKKPTMVASSIAPNKVQPTRFVRKRQTRETPILLRYGTSESPTTRTTELKCQASKGLKEKIFDIEKALAYDSADDFCPTVRVSESSPKSDHSTNTKRKVISPLKKKRCAEYR